MVKNKFLHKIRRLFTRGVHSVVFLAIMTLFFHLTFNVVGKAMQDMLAQGIDTLSVAVGHLLERCGTSPLLYSLVIEGLFPGVGSVLSFVPVIGVLFFFLSLMEESGYLSNVSLLMDGFMKHLGLSGQAVIPLIMGFGCNVPAIITAGSLLKNRCRTTVMLMIPFMSCSARLPIYSMFIAAFFENHRLPVLIALYSAGIFVAALTAMLLKWICLGFPMHSCDCAPTDIQSSEYFPQKLKVPSLKKSFYAACQSCVDFIKKAFTVIALASVAVWFLRSFGVSHVGLFLVTDSADSLLADLGRALAPFFAPCGFDDWRAISALVSGVFAKEAVISSLAILSFSGGAAFGDVSATSSELLAEIFAPLSAFCFMIFCLLYIPCIATVTAIKKETGSLRICLVLCIFQMVTAWLVSLLIFQAGGFIMQL